MNIFLKVKGNFRSNYSLVGLKGLKKVNFLIY